MAPKHDDTFYIDESSMVIFLVEDTLFRVPRQALVSDSEDNFFTEMFSAHWGDIGLLAEGMSDDSPIQVPSVVSAVAFRLFCHALYPYLSRKAVPVLSTPSNWASILELADMWQMESLRNMAMNALEDFFKDMVPEEKIVLGMKWKRRPWVMEGAREIVVQGSSMSRAQIEAIGCLATSRLASVREMLGGYLGFKITFLKSARVTCINRVQGALEDAVTEIL